MAHATVSLEPARPADSAGVDRRSTAALIVGLQGLTWTIIGLQVRVSGRATADVALQRQGASMLLVALAAFAVAAALATKRRSARPLAGIVEVFFTIGALSALVTAPILGVVELGLVAAAVFALIRGTSTARAGADTPAVPLPSASDEVTRRRGERPSGRRLVLVLSLVVALVAGLLLRQNLVFALAVLALIIMPIERLRPVRRQRVLRDQWLSDLVHFAVNGILSAAALVVVAGVLVVLTRLLVSPQLAATFNSWPGWVQLVLAIVVADIAAYWAHRSTHQIGWLWRFHAVHHSIEEMDWLASGRLHPFDQVWQQAWGAAVLVALGVSRETFGLWLVLLTFLAVFQHANVRLDLGPLRWFVANPQMHHWHHANHAEAMNTNFSGMMPTLDLLFGTAWCPKHQWPEAYGSTTPVPDNWWAQLAFPLRRRRA